MRIQELERQAVSFNENFKKRIAEGVADVIKHRIASWLEPSEKLLLQVDNQINPLSSAKQLLAKQETVDKRFGKISSIAAEIEEARGLQIKLKSAQIESLKPLLGLSEGIQELENHIENLKQLLKGSTLEPQNPKLVNIHKELLAINSLEELSHKKKSIEKLMSSEFWGNEICKEAFTIIERTANRIYALHTNNEIVEKNKEAINTPQQLIEYCLCHAKPLRLVIDGHNMIPKIKSFIGGQYFKEGQGPSSEGRKLLIERVRSLTDRHPLIEADIWFDGPVQEDWTETENLRIWFSGGEGSNRADKRILEGLQALEFSNKNEFRFLVTEDSDLLHKAKALKAIGVSPIEMWFMIN